MGWERGRYYTRSQRNNGRVVRQYVGCGPLASIAAEIDALARANRTEALDERQRLHSELERLAALVTSLHQVCDHFAKAALLINGFHQHKRGEWRKKRDPNSIR